MNLLDRWAQKRVEKINNKKAEQLRLTEQIEESKKLHIAKIKEQIYKELKVDESYMTTFLSVGDVAVLNAYGLSSKYAYNGWDNGCKSVFCNITDKHNYPKLVYVKITKITISYDYVDHIIENFIDYNNGCLSFIATHNAAAHFRNWCASKKCLFSENFGLYFEVFFEIQNFDFKPTWGLHSGCFLHVNSLEGKETIKLLSKVEEVDSKLRSLKSERENLRIKENLLKQNILRPIVDFQAIGDTSL